MLTAAQLEQRNACAMMLGEALTGVDFHVLCDMIVEHMGHRADVDPTKLEATAQVLSRMASRMEP